MRKITALPVFHIKYQTLDYDVIAIMLHLPKEENLCNIKEDAEKSTARNMPYRFDNWTLYMILGSICN